MHTLVCTLRPKLSFGQHPTACVDACKYSCMDATLSRLYMSSRRDVRTTEYGSPSYHSTRHTWRGVWRGPRPRQCAVPQVHAPTRNIRTTVHTVLDCSLFRGVMIFNTFMFEAHPTSVDPMFPTWVPRYNNQSVIQSVFQCILLCTCCGCSSSPRRLPLGADNTSPGAGASPPAGCSRHPKPSESPDDQHA